ncbi:T-cell surface glycoprotein CD8 alpha chain [Athene noctua]|uniref:T-cell surface glycoprotein CD8 alpha chain n=1 Tax=Athene noctua TaxID=126797 RepID=UPI003EBE3574
MAGSPALLLLLALELCCPGTHSQKNDMKVTFRDRTISHPKLGQRLELECQTTNAENGVFWVRQNKDGTLHFIAFISSLSRITFKEKQPSTRFEAKKERNTYHLTVKSFTAADEGNYFCFMNANQEMYFSRGQPAFFPVTTTAAPTALAPTTQSGTRKDPCLKTLDPENMKKSELSLFCDLFIWVPLAGACLLLLIALAVTAVLCQQTRRRRCRCKRPVNGKPNVKPSTPRQRT